MNTLKNEERITCLVPRNFQPSRQAFIDLGFTFMVIPKSNLCLATLPPGWKSVKDVYYWLDLIDKKGCKRGSYRYGDSNLIALYPRFYVSDDVDVIDNVNGKSLYHGVKPKDFLNEHYPDWEDPTKYWDLDESAIEYWY